MKTIVTRFLATLIFSALLYAPVAAALVSQPAVPASTQPDQSTVAAALKDFHSLSRKEKKERTREAKAYIKQWKADRKAGNMQDSDTNKVLLVILAILLPPLAVYLHQNEINSKFWISLVLTLIFWIPGVIYSLLVVLDAI